jgi:hypothetical protein
MTSAQVLQLLESAGHSSTPRIAPSSRPQPTAAPSSSTQKFAVQLIWSTTPVRAGSVPQLAIFEAYTLYTVQVERAGRRWYGLRLGFFKDPLSARQVALYARSDFAAAAVVPVSDRECDRAAQVATAAQALVAAPKAATSAPRPTDEIVLNDDQPAPAATVRRAAPAVSPAKARAAAEKPKLRQAPPPKVAASPADTSRSRPKRRAAKTAAELLEELGAHELGIETETDNEELSESGVRHLSVAVVSRQSALSRLLDRVGRRRAQ